MGRGNQVWNTLLSLNWTPVYFWMDIWVCWLGKIVPYDSKSQCCFFQLCDVANQPNQIGDHIQKKMILPKCSSSYKGDIKVILKLSCPFCCCCCYCCYCFFFFFFWGRIFCTITLQVLLQSKVCRTSYSFCSKGVKYLQGSFRHPFRAMYINYFCPRLFVAILCGENILVASCWMSEWVNEWSVTKATPWPSGYFFSLPDKLHVLRLSIYLDVYTNRSMCSYTVVLRPFGVSKGLRFLSFSFGPSHFFSSIVKGASNLYLKLGDNSRSSYFLTFDPSKQTPHRHYRPITGDHQLLTWKDFDV